MADREFNIVLWGATGFTGKLVATLIARQFGVANSSIKFALAGRSLSRLQEVLTMMTNEAKENSTDPQIRRDAGEVKSGGKAPTISLVELKDWGKGNDINLASSLCKRTDVIIALAGPFEDCGEPIVKAAAECGTDYCDITGEYNWVSRMHEKYNQTAIDNKARIIPCCGFDYILNDIGLYYIQDYAKSRNQPIFNSVVQIAHVEGSSASGGTLRTVFKSLKSKSLCQLLSGKVESPFIACTKKIQSEEIIHSNQDVKFLHYSKTAGEWMAPTFMGPPMKRYLHWVNEIQDFSYGKDLIYHVGNHINSVFGGLLTSLLLIFSGICLALISRFDFISNRIMHASGEGRPTADLEKSGNYVELKTFGKMKTGSNPLRACYTIKFDKGEGYIMTAYGALNSALCLLKARKGEFSCSKFGLGSPTSILGNLIVDQLKLSKAFHFTLNEKSL